MFRPPTKYSEYLIDVRKSIDYILKRVNATTVTKIVAGTNVTISPASGTGAVTINASGGGGGGLPAGGTTGQILAKINNVDYNAEWIDNYAQWTSTLKQEVKASESINKGQAVYVSTADGTNMIVSKSSNTTEATSSKTLGLLAQNLATNGKGFVITEGLLSGLDTSTANIGDPVWLGANGNLIFGLVNKPYAPLHLVSIGIVTRVNSNNGEIFVKVQNGFELDELHNVDARNPNNNDGIFYNSSTLLWEHKPVSSVYATPTLDAVTTAGNTTTNAITVGGLTSNASSIIIGAAAGTLGSRVLTIQGSLPEIFFKDTFGTGTGFSLSKYGSLFYFVNTTSAGAYTNYAGVINPLAASWSFGHGGNPTATVHVKGANVLSSTKALLVQNSSPTDLLTIWNDGAVGINTSTNAGYKLDVNGTGRFTNNLSITKSYNLTWGTNQQINVTDYPSYFSGGYNVMSFISSSSGAVAEDGSFVWRNAGTSANLMVLTGTGRLGLGTTPSYPLHISSSAAANIFATVQATNASASAAWVGFNDQSDNIVYRVFGSSVSGTQFGQSLTRSASLIANLGGTGKFLIGTYSSTDLVFGTGDQSRMRLVDSTGNFLVGTMTDAGNKLEVSGTVNATAYKINGILGWSGIINIPTIPPISITVNNGIITNVM